jgi:hypothetical protein
MSKNTPPKIIYNSLESCIIERLNLSKKEVSSLLSTYSDNEYLDFLITHQEIEIRKAIDGDYFDIKYADLFTVVKKIKEELKEVDARPSVKLLLELGGCISSMPSELEQKSKLIEEEIKQLKQEIKTIPLKFKSTEMSQLKEFAQLIAKDKWGSPTYEELRISDMSDEVYSQLYKFFNNTLQYNKFPEKEAIKKWIREIAPASAKKRGRPINKAK